MVIFFASSGTIERSKGIAWLYVRHVSVHWHRSWKGKLISFSKTEKRHSIFLCRSGWSKWLWFWIFLITQSVFLVSARGENELFNLINKKMDICTLSRKRSRRLWFFLCVSCVCLMSPDRVHSFKSCTLSVFARFPHWAVWQRSFVPEKKRNYAF